jgi:hypothetical protein
MKTFDFLKGHEHFSRKNHDPSSRTCDFYFDVRDEKDFLIERGFISINKDFDSSLPTFLFLGPNTRFTEDEEKFSPWFLEIKKEVETHHTNLTRIRHLFKQKDLL